MTSPPNGPERPFNKETLQKPKATGTSIADAVRDDSGSVDPVDFQYVLFNLLVAVAVALSFAVNVEDGLPVVADFLAILTGGSALTYTLNKGVSTNAPTLRRCIRRRRASAIASPRTAATSRSSLPRSRR